LTQQVTYLSSSLTFIYIVIVNDIEEIIERQKFAILTDHIDLTLYKY